MEFDIEKAYNSVDRHHLDEVLSKLGVADNSFYRLAAASRDEGSVYISGGRGISQAFGTARVMK